MDEAIVFTLEIPINWATIIFSTFEAYESYVHNLLPQMRTPIVSFLAGLNISKTPHVIKMK